MTTTTASIIVNVPDSETLTKLTIQSKSATTAKPATAAKPEIAAKPATANNTYQVLLDTEPSAMEIESFSPKTPVSKTSASKTPASKTPALQTPTSTLILPTTTLSNSTCPKWGIL